MSSKSDFEALLPQLMAIPADKVIRDAKRNMHTVAQEAENLHWWAVDHRDELKDAKLPIELLDSMENREGAFRYAQAIWEKAQKRRTPLLARVMATEPAIRNDRDELAALLRFRYFGMKDLEDKLDQIMVKDTQDILPQQLNDLYVLARKNPGLLQEGELKRFEEAADRSDRWSDDLAGKDVGVDHGTEKDVRDRAYTFLLWATREVRRFGRFVFRHDPERLAGYLLPARVKASSEVEGDSRGDQGSQGAG